MAFVAPKKRYAGRTGARREHPCDPEAPNPSPFRSAGRSHGVPGWRRGGRVLLALEARQVHRCVGARPDGPGNSASGPWAASWRWNPNLAGSARCSLVPSEGAWPWAAARGLGGLSRGKLNEGKERIGDGEGAKVAAARCGAGRPPTPPAPAPHARCRQGSLDRRHLQPHPPHPPGVQPLTGSFVPSYSRPRCAGSTPAPPLHAVLPRRACLAGPTCAQS